MKISQLAAKPKLVKIILDSKDIVEEFGDPVEVWTLDRQPLDVFMKLASANQGNYSEMVNILRTMILDEDGQQVITGDVMIPTSILIASMTAITEMLGK
jgi:hypothetical protein